MSDQRIIVTARVVVAVMSVRADPAYEAENLVREALAAQLHPDSDWNGQVAIIEHIVDVVA